MSPSAALRRISVEVAPREGRRAGEDLAEDRAQGEDVGPLVDQVDLAPGLLGGHVARRAQHRAGVGQVRVRAAPRRRDQRLLGRLLAGPRIIGDTAARQDLGQAPVHHLDLAEAADHHVRRLQVAMDHAAGVGVGHRLAMAAKIDRNRGRSSAGSRAGREQVGQRPPFHQLHGEERPPVGEGPQLVDRHDARDAAAGRRSGPPRRTGGPGRRCRGGLPAAP